MLCRWSCVLSGDRPLGDRPIWRSAAPLFGVPQRLAALALGATQRSAVPALSTSRRFSVCLSGDRIFWRSAVPSLVNSGALHASVPVHDCFSPRSLRRPSPQPLQSRRCGGQLSAASSLGVFGARPLPGSRVRFLWRSAIPVLGRSSATLASGCSVLQGSILLALANSHACPVWRSAASSAHSNRVRCWREDETRQ